MNGEIDQTKRIRIVSGPDYGEIGQIRTPEAGQCARSFCGWRLSAFMTGSDQRQKSEATTTLTNIGSSVLDALSSRSLRRAGQLLHDRED